MRQQVLQAVVLAGLLFWAVGNAAEVSKASVAGADGSPQSQSTSQAVAEPLLVVYFDVATCPECKKVRDALPQIAEEWGARIRLEIKDVAEMMALEELFLYADHYGKEVEAPPAIFVGRQVLIETEDIRAHLNVAIRDSLAAAASTWVPDVADRSDAVRRRAALARIIQQFRGFRAGAVATAGLIDGINPCAFTTIVFLLSMLAYLGRTRREMAVVGVGFTAAVFLTYLLLGLGLLTAVKRFSVQSGVATGLAYAVAVLAFVLAGWSLVDAIRYRRTADVKTVTLGLPRAVKERIHAVIRTGMKTRGLLAGSISVGCLVAVLESLCTGQVYLPTIMFVARAPGMRASAVGYLLLYNGMFILPLAVILVIAYLGVKSDALGRFLRSHLATVKFALAILFAALGVLVLATV